jgi:triphosphoribosyl-dephospho-CoA synthase
MPDPSPLRLTLGQCATLACLLEAAAPKVGNVHRSADFESLTFYDFLASAVAIGPAIEAAPSAGVGRTVLDSVAATRQVVSTNTNLGIVLLLAPLAVVPREMPLGTAAVHQVLAGLTPDDCRLVYGAIRIAQPGGLGKVKEMDVADEPPADLLLAMHAAADRDLVARQYVEDFRLVLDQALPLLVAGRTSGWPLAETIVRAHLQLLSQCEDSLIVRKCGYETARKVSTMAGDVLAQGGPGDEGYYQALADFDFWLRSDGHHRNPGTTADLIAAALFAGLRDGLIQPPFN